MDDNFSLCNAIQQLCQLMPHGIVAIKDDKIIWLNNEAKKIFGNALNKNWIDFISPEHREKIAGLFEIAKKKEANFIRLNANILNSEKNNLSIFLIYIAGLHFLIFELGRDAVQSIMHSLKEKIKMLSCLYEIEKVSREKENLDDILFAVANIVPNILQHSELACCKIILDEKEYFSENYETMQAFLSADIQINGNKRGEIKVGYVVETPGDFFEEEKQILQHIAMKIADIVERMESKEEVWRSKAYFQALVEESTDVIMVIDENTIVEYISPSIEKILGYKQEEIVGRSALEFVHPDDLEIVLKKFEETLNNPEKVVSTSFRVLCKDGKHIYANVKGRNLLKNPVVNGIVVNFHNITELVEKERALKEKGEMLRALFNATHDLILLIKKDGTILEYNETMEKALGVKREEAIGKSIYDYKYLLDEKTFKRRIGYLKEVIETKKPVHFIDSRKGRWFDNTYYPILNEDGEVIQVAIFAKDITELKEMEERLKQVIENVNEWVWEVDENGLYTFSSPAIEKILGYKPEEIVGKKHFYDLFHPEDRERLKREAFKNFKEKKPFRSFLNRNLHKNGEERWLLTSGVPVLDENGNLKGYRGLDIDITEKKKAQDELKKLNKFLESIIENANVWIDVLDEKGNVILWNKAAEKISGYKAEEVVGHKKIWEWLYPDDNYRKKIFAKAMKIIRGEEVESFETTITTKSGEKKIISWYSRNLVEDGKIIGSVALGIDVTEKRKAEKITQTLIDATHDLMLLAKTDGTILNLNNAMAKALGKEKEKIIGTNINEYLPPDIYEYRTKKVREIEKTKKPAHFIDSRKGRWFDHHFYPVFDENGKVTQIAIFSRDITKQREAEKESRKFKTIADNANYGVLIFDLNGRISYVNEYFSRVHGYEKGELIGKNIKEISCSGNLLLHIKEKIIENGKIDAIEIYQKRKDGKIFPMLITGVLIHEDGSSYIAVTAIDISEKKEMEERLAEQKKLASLGRIAAVVAHELNTPLANILVTAEYLAERVKKYRNELEVIKNEVKNATSIIRDVLSFSRMEIKEKKRVNLGEVIEEAIEKVKRMGIADDVIIDNRVNDLEIKGDRQRLLGCFVNIIKNAVMAKDENKNNHFVIIDAVENKNAVDIIIRDNGTGMSEDIQKNALKPFFTTRPLGEGTGLGLFIANWIAEEHGGGIKIKSKKGGGTEVKVRLKK